MKILYINPGELETASGVTKKIYGQIKSMRRSGIEVSLLSFKRGDIVVEDVRGTKILMQNLPKVRFALFSRIRRLYSCAYKYVCMNDVNAVFIRYSFSEPFLLFFLRRLKRSSIKIFVEIATYPYDLEYNSKEWYKKIKLVVDKVFRLRLKKYVDYIFTPCFVRKDIFGIKTQVFENGVDIFNSTRRDYKGNKKDTLRLLAVANISAWHGYDRVIRGIKAYDEKNNAINFIFNIVGEGVELPNLKKLAKNLSLEEKIIFHGKKDGKELDDIYNMSDVAVSSIALFRLASTPRPSLKIREACIKAIPVITTKGDTLPNNNFNYIFFVRDEETPVDMQKVYDWFHSLKSEQYLEEMYNFARKYLSWDYTFKRVIEKIEEVVEEN
jgi:glycosyltransferase involved in cell wall biosynthesis